MKNCLELITNIQKQSGIVQGLTLSLDSIIFIIVGSLISGFGLLYNNYITVLGSMLISPIGSAIIRYSLGYRYAYRPFLIQGVNSLIAQAVIGLTIGYMMGIINKETGEKFKIPTEEMSSRTNQDNYISDFTISLLCGFILSYSILHKEIVPITGLSLVVAVLPPIVNAGLYISIAHSAKSLEDYHKNMLNARKTFLLAVLNVVGISLSTIIGFYIFCKE